MRASIARQGVALFMIFPPLAVADPPPDNCSKWAEGGTGLVSIPAGATLPSAEPAFITTGRYGIQNFDLAHDSASADGSVVVFAVDAGTGDPNGRHAFVRLRALAETVDLGPGTRSPSVSADGCYLAYVRLTTYVDPNSVERTGDQVWRYDLCGDPNDPNSNVCVTCRLSILIGTSSCLAQDGGLFGHALTPSISADGGVVSFSVKQGDEPQFRVNPSHYLYLFDFSVAPSADPFWGYSFLSRTFYALTPPGECEQEANSLGWFPALAADVSAAVSGDGRYFVWRTIDYDYFSGFTQLSIIDPNVACSDPNSFDRAIILFDRESIPPHSELISVSACCNSAGYFADKQPAKWPQGYAISDSGRFVAFAWNDPTVDTRLSLCHPDPNYPADPNLLFDPNDETHVFVTDRAKDIDDPNRCIRVTYTPQTGRAFNQWPTISADGRYLSFTATASPDSFDDARIFLLDRGSGPPYSLANHRLEIVNRRCGHSCEYVPDSSRRSWISDDGMVVAFESVISSSLPSDACLGDKQFPAEEQVYVLDRNLKPTCPFSNQACFADFDCDGTVDQDDLDRILFAYGSVIGDEAFECRLDYDCDGDIDQDDLDVVLFVYEETCSR